ncbi:helix-turn-helix transcriptional regulator [Tetragenococcus halophilus]|uniref:Putative Xre family DNA-binding protein n=1 Tax=Tetragenococcus halophilus subsp. halophilus TaxID=1513897 RepID=A0A2H6DK54_TETHA|nr:putative Xre family DNA-binding protein [Tetragenococcus halophilus subsp. halophilus]GMG61385.1 helix-turn-helix transcriptional regulator [Tetragenococcus halophilus]GBD67519.1 putative Xre family DNA-binding protein [Tetragenococcus halophilus subsp. halophilus]GBD77608.1 putative Xre family DNA-binding protein [Tetragenococcus halophilus subsp. halophilus]GMG63915.1 helix-turn-helix transcriptional regulator [Tetragenococcus halophilus]
MQSEKRLVIHIHDLTQKYNMSLRELSRQSGIDIARLSELANGKRKRVNIDFVIKIAEALNITDIREIFTIEDK